MPFADIDGIKINYRVMGSGTPMVMLSPGGFDASIRRWEIGDPWKDLKPFETLTREFKLIVYDRRESGESGGRVEPLTWENYAREAKGLMDHLALDKALILGQCMGCSVALAMAALFPERCQKLLMRWPVGGFLWRKKCTTFFDRHIAFAHQNGLANVVTRARQTKSFWDDSESGPWASVIAMDAGFAEAYARLDLERYLQTVIASKNNLYPDTMPSGANGEQLQAIKTPSFIMSGNDPAHAHSAAHALRELMPNVELSAVMPPGQNAAAVSRWIHESATT